MTDHASPDPVLSSRFEEALCYAVQLHRDQSRKSTTIPYASHLLIVAGYVLDDGGTEDEAIAALLHDAAEDQGGEATLAAIRERFGDRVAKMVRACTDAWTEPKPEWRPRKEAYIASLQLQRASSEVRRISAADKLANARAILRDFRSVGVAVFERFGGRPAAETLWYYRSLADEFMRGGPRPFGEELGRVVAELERSASPAPG